ncbi:MAG: 2,3-bisphosphoglycerate-independent phosphoglycerate mutase [Candidatus Magasanikbacteria bacterium]|nr:2,3-bisphosphoglycerate-independent phosphoglycerate mutase [Candidatus Magasanikbacteria bacterium]
MKTKPTVLAIMDGWGIAPIENKGNPITPKNAPNFFSWLKKYPNTEIAASGESVGLFKGEDGNSEAGHMNLGAGRVVQQDAIYISDAIEDGTFFKNPAFHQALHHLHKYKTAAHVMGLLSNHNSAHSCPEHLYALLDFLRSEGVKKIFLHLFTDGRDSGQHDAPKHLKKLREHMKNGEKIATITGRFYAMDRGKNWDRLKGAYEAIVMGRGVRCTAHSAEEAIAQAYNSGETDEYICPTVIMDDGHPVTSIKDNDVIFFFNLRSDRARELTKAFVQPDFEQINDGAFHRAFVPKNTRFVAMTDFGPDLPHVLTAYPSRDVVNSLPRVLCPHQQLYIAETEKFAHVTYFFNGGYGRHFCDERWIKIASVEVKNYKDRPEMSAKLITDVLTKAIEKDGYEFVCVNFANPDMVAHSGDMEATAKAIRTVDTEMARLIKVVERLDGQMIITADHGNAEELVNLKTGEVDTEHSTNPVPFIVVGKKYSKSKLKLRKNGKLGDVAPTILKMMDIPKPKEMTGKSIF